MPWEIQKKKKNFNAVFHNTVTVKIFTKIDNDIYISLLAVAILFLFTFFNLILDAPRT
jgi:hypothetical protein